MNIFTEDQLAAEMCNRGYGLIVHDDVVKSCNIALPILIKVIIENMRATALYRGLPIVLTTAEDSELKELAAQTFGTKIHNPVGYLCEITAAFLPRSFGARRLLLEDISDNFHPPLEKEYIFSNGLKPRTIDLFRRLNSDFANRWNVVDGRQDRRFSQILEQYLK